MIDHVVGLKIGAARYGVARNSGAQNILRVCSMCGDSMGEKAPFDDKGKTHGYCASCEKKVMAENLVEAPSKAECAWCAHTKAEHIGGSCKKCNCKAKFNSENASAVAATCICGHADNAHESSGTRRCNACSCVQYLKDEAE